MNLPPSLPFSAPRSWWAALRPIWIHARHDLLYISWALMEVCLILPFSLALLSWARYWPSRTALLWLLLVMLVPFNLLRLMNVLRLPYARQQTVMTLGLILLLLLTSSILIYHTDSVFDLRWIPTFFRHINQKGNQLWVRDVGLFLLIMFTWSRGAALANREFGVEKVGLFLRVGGLILTPFVIWLAQYRLSWDVTGLVLLFLAAGLTAVSLIRLEELETQKSGFSASLHGRWIGGIFAVILSIILTGGVLTAVISGQSIFIIATWLSPIGTALTFSGLTIISTLTYLAFPLLETGLNVLIRLLGILLYRLLQINLGGIAPTPYNEQPILTLDDLNILARQAGMGTKIVIFLLMFGVVLVISLSINYLYRWAKLRQQTLVLVNSSRPSEFVAQAGQRLWQRLGLWRNWRTAVSIRHLYRQMSRAAAANGYPRAASETPYEYLRTLARVWPDHLADARLITEAYIAVRYGELPETEAEFAAIWQAWHRLEQAKPTTKESNAPKLPT